MTIYLEIEDVKNKSSNKRDDFDVKSELRSPVDLKKWINSKKTFKII